MDTTNRDTALPARAGVGLKADHYETVLAERPDIGWFEVHAENYMGAGGPAHYYLEKIRADYPLSIHGVGLSIGSHGPLDTSHLQRLKILVERYQPEIFSEHLAWSSHGGVYFNDLLPLPYTPETVSIVADHIDQLQNALGRRMFLENPSTYVVFEHSTMGEIEFLRAVADRSGCGLLLDVNNVHVSATNHDYSPTDYLDAFPVELVGEIHLGGHAPDRDDEGRELLIDAHDRAVADRVWALYERVLSRAGRVPTLIEWDTDVPAWPVLFDQARAAEHIMDRLPAGSSRAIAG